MCIWKMTPEKIPRNKDKLREGQENGQFSCSQLLLSIFFQTFYDGHVLSLWSRNLYKITFIHNAKINIQITAI